MDTDRASRTEDDRPLAGVTVLVPRSRRQASRLSARIRALGGQPLEAPTITVEPGDAAALQAAVRDLAAGAYRAVCLTSPTAVDVLAGAAADAGVPAPLSDVPVVACVGTGSATRVRDRFGREPDLVPGRATSDALGEEFPPGSGRVLLPRADLAGPALVHALLAKGYEPIEVVAYRTGRPAALPDDVLDALAAGRVDVVAFASSSTARNFAVLVGDRPWRADVVSIGPVTSATCRELGLPVGREADPHDLDGLVAAIVAVASASGRGT
ncbi:MAG: uroporphyrinogen-III synthase [Actinobacteria bacterium]|nr:uroporphyrinogen-III synthase [Actinomycetota bacterium]